MDSQKSNLQMNKNNLTLSKREVTRLFATMASYVIKYEYMGKFDALMYVMQQKDWQSELEEPGTFPKIDELFMVELIDGVEKNLNAIHQLIKANIRNKSISLDEMDKLVLSILELACYEMIGTDIDKKIIIKQYIFIASCFFNKHEIGMINAILDTIYQGLKNNN
jgi:transcription termination factor NusB